MGITSIDMCHYMLGILTCLSPQDAKIAFESFLDVIDYEIEKGKKVHYRNTLFPKYLYYMIYSLIVIRLHY